MRQTRFYAPPGHHAGGRQIVGDLSRSISAEDERPCPDATDVAPRVAEVIAREFDPGASLTTWPNLQTRLV